MQASSANTRPSKPASSALAHPEERKEKRVTRMVAVSSLLTHGAWQSWGGSAVLAEEALNLIQALMVQVEKLLLLILWTQRHQSEDKLRLTQ